MENVENIITTAMTLAGRGDKPSNDDLNRALRILNTILQDWATTRGVTLWNILEDESPVLTADTVIHNGAYYLCYRAHNSASANEPGIGEGYTDYWIATSATDGATAWVTSYPYSPNNTIALSPFNLEDIIALRVLNLGQYSTVEKISLLEYKQLDRQAIGIPTHAYIEKLESALSIHLWPINNMDQVTLFYHSIMRPMSLAASDYSLLPGQWIQALYYALAVELGFLYNISMERLNVLGQKAQLEFAKAFRSNESEVDRCFVKPLF